jgi:hypothetical protein
MKQLYDVCTAPAKEWKDFPDGTHNDTVSKQGYFAAIADFLEKHAAR